MSTKLIVCTMQRLAPNPHSCGNSGSLDIASRLEKKIADAGLHVSVEHAACLGMCLKGPNVRLLPEGKTWHEVRHKDIAEIVAYLKGSYSKL